MMMMLPPEISQNVKGVIIELNHLGSQATSISTDQYLIQEGNQLPGTLDTDRDLTPISMLSAYRAGQGKMFTSTQSLE